MKEQEFHVLSGHRGAAQNMPVGLDLRMHMVRFLVSLIKLDLFKNICLIRHIPCER